ncbi:hypothetical protein LRQ08_29785 (plasmid) [Rhodococcus qingshengii]|uniref:hypothetical protein n=1 Tax=Rhodococcus qingshengii TaxID=334542 RepID=UPI0021116A2A|nr:hypothetical protein [Rhodococcus qingshengii]UUE28650.1 hypothetical protein LRQ08_29785 [Rhodococcus qingshengii]
MTNELSTTLEALAHLLDVHHIGTVIEHTHDSTQHGTLTMDAETGLLTRWITQSDNNLIADYELTSIVRPSHRPASNDDGTITLNFIRRQDKRRTSSTATTVWHDIPSGGVGARRKSAHAQSG